MSLTYTKDELNQMKKFIVWYKYEAAKQQLLDSWKYKRMTGLRLSWRIENENPPLTANISEVGRSIVTPNTGNTYEESSKASLDRVYTAILTPPKSLLQQVGDD